MADQRYQERLQLLGRMAHPTAVQLAMPSKVRAAECHKPVTTVKVKVERHLWGESAVPVAQFEDVAEDMDRDVVEHQQKARDVQTRHSVIAKRAASMQRALKMTKLQPNYKVDEFRVRAELAKRFSAGVDRMNTERLRKAAPAVPKPAEAAELQQAEDGTAGTQQAGPDVADEEQAAGQSEQQSGAAAAAVSAAQRAESMRRQQAAQRQSEPAAAAMAGTTALHPAEEGTGQHTGTLSAEHSLATRAFTTWLQPKAAAAATDSTDPTNTAAQSNTADANTSDQETGTSSQWPVPAAPTFPAPVDAVGARQRLLSYAGQLPAPSQSPEPLPSDMPTRLAMMLRSSRWSPTPTPLALQAPTVVHASSSQRPSTAVPVTQQPRSLALEECRRSEPYGKSLMPSDKAPSTSGLQLDKATLGRIKRRVQQEQIMLPSLCACGHNTAITDSHYVSQCCQNCPLFKDPAGWEALLVSVLQSYGLMPTAAGGC